MLPDPTRSVQHGPTNLSTLPSLHTLRGPNPTAKFRFRALAIAACSLLAFTVLATLATPAGAAARIDSKLSAALAKALPTDLLSVIVVYNAAPTPADALNLRAFGIKYGVTLKQLPMAGAWATPAQVGKIAALGNVRSVYLNSKLTYYNHEATAITGVTAQRTMPGFGYSGKGVTVAVVDSGIDATHPDLPFGVKVKQNVKVAMGGASLGSPFEGVVPATYAEGLPDTDIDCGHGTHCAGIIGGLGTQSGGAQAGVAPGADLVGLSCGDSIVILSALEAWDYALTHRYTYNIKVVSNSWGTSGAFDAEDPINVASKAMHDNGMTVVFASGNEGPGSNTLNPYSVASWVIGVAAGDKKGRLADFSSRGLKDDAVYHPTLTAPGVSIVSCRAKGSVLGAVSGDIVDDPSLPPAQIPYYMHLSGTSMATPNVAGSVALLLEANPALTPDQIKSLLTVTATRMGGYEAHETGSGYMNVLAALDLAKNAGKSYGAALSQVFNAKFTGSIETLKWDQAFDPSGPPPTHDYNVAANGVLSDVFISWENDPNTFNLAVTDPFGTTVSTGNNLLAEVYGFQASLSFSQPAAGGWHTTVYGVRGQSSGTTGIGVPDTIHGTITNYYGTFSGISDLDDTPYAVYIRQAVALRLMDSYSGNSFAPHTALTRGEAARIIASDCGIRQNQLAPAAFTDVPAALQPYVAAVTSAGGPLRDTFLAGGAVMGGVTATTFAPSDAVDRASLAVWLVRALGMEADAQANMTAATAFTDDAQIPASARGYVVVAANLGLMPGYTDASTVPGAPVTYSWKPASFVVRGEMAMIIVKWRELFLAP